MVFCFASLYRKGLKTIHLCDIMKSPIDHYLTRKRSICCAGFCISCANGCSLRKLDIFERNKKTHQKENLSCQIEGLRDRRRRLCRLN